MTTANRFGAMRRRNKFMNARDAFYEILRTHGITTIFGNPGSNELPLSAASPTPDRTGQHLRLRPSDMPVNGPIPASGPPQLPPAGTCRLPPAGNWRSRWRR
jgi:hypothetical protein